jgi:hypothetical protein
MSERRLGLREKPRTAGLAATRKSAYLMGAILRAGHAVDRDILASAFL